MATIQVEVYIYMAENWRKKIAGFINKFGFYLILLICLAVIGVTAILTRGGGEDRLINEEGQPGIEEESQVADNAPEDDIDISITDVIDEESDDASSEDSNEEKVTEENDETTNIPPNGGGTAKTDDDVKADEEIAEDVPTSAKASNQSAYDMAMPVDGKVIRSYSADRLVYSPTLKEWTTHMGVDIAGSLGGEVRAALDGVVESIEEDSLRGIVITLSHDDNLKTVYMGLSTGDMVRVGQQVQKGQVISGIGRTAAFEILDDAHVHFEVLLNGEHQDPANYLKFE